MLENKHILLGVTGGIAAYKSAWLVRELKKAVADVQVVMTKSATEFITPLTLSTLSQRKVLLDLFPPSPDETSAQWTEHVQMALWADIMVIVPASANTVAKLAHGLADNFLTTLVLALRSPLGVSPAMDVDMYNNEITQRNIDILRETGCFVLDPEEGELASGLSGQGRLPEIERIVKWIDGILENTHQDLRDRKVLVSAGPTFEPIDPVRFIGNRSSGKMGFALANAAAQRGASVTLVSGPVHLRTPRNVKRIDVHKAEEMQKAMDKEFQTTDCVLMAAAVGDYAAETPSQQKLKREGKEQLSLQLKANPDILKNLGGRKKKQVMVGFALETENEVAHARKKLAAKNLDLIILNNPNVEGAGFDADTNVVTLISSDGMQERLPKNSKFNIAHQILDRVVPLLK
ncbi:MAG TPA: bifunctional phosphopantothenoylcysteine decarboxylase/phosphopantothenate--cysteine ligase CoaBC [Bacteroidota bacterium]